MKVAIFCSQLFDLFLPLVDQFSKKDMLSFRMRLQSKEYQISDKEVHQELRFDMSDGTVEGKKRPT